MEFSIDLGQLVGDVSRRLTTTQADLHEVLEGQKKRIQDRTRAGVDIDGAAFAPYAKSTGKTGPVTLGDLPDSIVTEVLGSEEGHVFVPAPKDVIALAHNTGTSRMPQRHFMGISDLDRAEITEEIKLAVLNRAKSHS